MSKKYKSHIIDILITAFVLVFLPLVVPLTIIIGGTLKFVHIKGKYIMYISSAITVITCTCFSSQLNVFISEVAKAISLAYEAITNSDFIMLLNVYKVYSFFSYFVMCLIALLISAYFITKYDKDTKLEKSGIKSLKAGINDMNLNQNSNKADIKYKLEESTLIGINKAKKAVYCSDSAKHIFCCGTTGSGKTVLLSNFIKSACNKNYGMLIVDGKGDVGEGSILEITKQFCKTYKRKLYVVSMNEPQQSAKYNPFLKSSDTIAKDMLVNMSDWSEEHYKANAERYIQRVVKLLNLNGEKLSFKSIVSAIQNDNFLILSNKLVNSGKQTKEEHIKNKELYKSSGKIAESAAARFATIQESEIGIIFDENGIDIYTALKENAVILFVLNPLLYPETSKVLGRLILIDSKKAISKLFNSKSNRKFFIFDEINVYASTVLIDLINKSRSANVTCIPATQSLADLESVAGNAFKQQIIENCNNYVVLRQNSYSSAEEWAKTLGTQQTMKMTYQISKTESTDMGTAKQTREFLVHPDEIKAQQTGQGVFLSRDNGKCERIKIIKPF